MVSVACRWIFYRSHLPMQKSVSVTAKKFWTNAAVRINEEKKLSSKQQATWKPWLNGSFLAVSVRNIFSWTVGSQCLLSLRLWRNTLM
jgi:hypothetical protein